MAHLLPKLENPELYRCKIFRYDKGHGQLHIHLRNSEDKQDAFFYLFSSIHYFSGQLYRAWNGANFVVGTPAELLEVARRIEGFHHKSDAELLSHKLNLCLYTVQLPYDTMLILSGAAIKTHTTRY